MAQTMVTAAEDKKPAPQRALESIPVFMVRWDRPLQIPGKQADDMVKTETLTNGRGWVVDYIPGMRHFRIKFFDRDRKTEETGYVHESRALSWKPQ